ncbi:Uma2 family endonuclease [Prochlorothrix hollandica]|uniref:Putative restriction endonuclease domain-containing protein n=1 Tax=Prochlorothrix hollandica PCC 9006 = CALU 1027 TaxID=317619 RepID=A0A0M2PWH6_PROHO|nr:Uma2 family endonuclease [Prochlorothrix hollandica]KKI99018.1 hypothetical protein PROH_14510 [Prochlorothrix hollandica PCC 9006 = CALU 1027]
MVRTTPVNPTKVVNFEEFVQWCPEGSTERYELHGGTVVAMPKPKGKHSQIAGFLMTELSVEIRRLGLPYFVPRECVVKTGEWSGYEPDVIVLDRQILAGDGAWERASTVDRSEAVRLVVEVVSGNWSDDYALKLDAYEGLGIAEYWIVDYLGLGGRKFIGTPKQPTFSVYSLSDNFSDNLSDKEYAVKQFRGRETIVSSVFPDLRLRAEEVFGAGA